MAESGKATDKAANKRNFFATMSSGFSASDILEEVATEWLECWQTRAGV